VSEDFDLGAGGAFEHAVAGGVEVEVFGEGDLSAVEFEGEGPEPGGDFLDVAAPCAGGGGVVGAAGHGDVEGGAALAAGGVEVAAVKEPAEEVVGAVHGSLEEGVQQRLDAIPARGVEIGGNEARRGGRSGEVGCGRMGAGALVSHLLSWWHVRFSRR